MTALAGAGHFKPEDGKSLLCLLKDITGKTCDYQGENKALLCLCLDSSCIDFLRPGNPGPWRAYLDLENSNVYNETVHWNALTDGEIKYIFNAFYPSEMLFNLSADPGMTSVIVIEALVDSL